MQIHIKCNHEMRFKIIFSSLTSSLLWFPSEPGQIVHESALVSLQTRQPREKDSKRVVLIMGIVENLVVPFHTKLPVHPMAHSGDVKLKVVEILASSLGTSTDMDLCTKQ